MPVDSVPPIGPLPILDALPSVGPLPTGEGAFSRELVRISSDDRSAIIARENQATDADRTERPESRVAEAANRRTKSPVERKRTDRDDIRDVGTSANRSSGEGDRRGATQDSTSKADKVVRGRDASGEEDKRESVDELDEEPSVAVEEKLVPAVIAIPIVAPIEDALPVEEATTMIEAEQKGISTDGVAAIPIAVADTASAALSPETQVQTPDGAEAAIENVDVNAAASIQVVETDTVDSTATSESEETTQELDSEVVALVNEESASQSDEQDSLPNEEPEANTSGELDKTRNQQTGPVSEESVASADNERDLLQRESVENSRDSSASLQAEISAASEQPAATNAALEPAPEIQQPAVHESIHSTVTQNENHQSQGTTTSNDPSVVGAGNTTSPSRFNPSINGRGQTRPIRPATIEVDAARFVQRVSRAFAAAEARGGEVRLRLSPPELGSLRLEVSVDAGVMTARVETETSAARAVLLDNLPQLRERLAEQGMKIDRFDVDVSSQNPGGTPNSPQEERDNREHTWRQQVPAARTPRSDGTGPKRNDEKWDDNGLNVLV